jgi:phage antirepressor YoqD-like protein
MGHNLSGLRERQEEKMRASAEELSGAAEIMKSKVDYFDVIFHVSAEPDTG